MKSFLNVAGILLIVGGGIWILQGLNVLPGSFMSGQMRWAINGAIAASVGIALLVWTNVIRRNSRR